jgi:hypothetical protein
MSVLNGVQYDAPRVVGEFLQDDSRFRVIVGPFGSGKSSGCVVEVVKRAKQQRICTGGEKKGKRATRFAVVRNTMPQLRDTTIKTWFSWFPDGSCGWWKETGKTFFVEFGDVYSEVCFRALDDANDVKNLLSLELTGAYINECREIPREIVEGLKGRIERYPAVKDGGCTWAGVWADTNPPEEGSYWHALMEGLDPDSPTEAKSSGWTVFKQPPGMLKVDDGRGGKKYIRNPDADNVENLPDGYYEKLAQDNSAEYVRVYVMGEYGTSKQGKPVHPLFDPDIHMARERLIPNLHLPLVVSADFGRTPAMTLKQQDVWGRVLTFDEIVTESMGLERAINEKLKPLLRRRYEDFALNEIRVTGDPAGNTASQNDEKTCVTIFKNCGFKKVKFAVSNNPIVRWGATDHFLQTRNERGPAYLIDPTCVYLKTGMKGGYHFKIHKTTQVRSDEPDKNIYSHICEAGNYGDMYFQIGVERLENKADRERILAQARASRGVYTRR